MRISVLKNKTQRQSDAKPFISSVLIDQILNLNQINNEPEKN